MRESVNGTCSEGFTTNVFPHTTANGRNQSGTIAGKLNGATAAQTPTGWRKATQSRPGATFSRLCPMSIDGAPQATSTHSMPRRTLPRDSSSVLPCSVVTSRASSSTFSSRSARKRNIARARAAGGVWLHPGKAADAAAAAASTSARVDSGVRAITVPRAGLWTSRESRPADGTRRPPM